MEYRATEQDVCDMVNESIQPPIQRIEEFEQSISDLIRDWDIAFIYQTPSQVHTIVTPDALEELFISIKAEFE